MSKIFEDRKLFFRVLNIIFVNTNLKKKMKYRTSIVSEVIKNRRIRTKNMHLHPALVIIQAISKNLNNFKRLEWKKKYTDTQD